MAKILLFFCFILTRNENNFKDPESLSLKNLLKAVRYRKARLKTKLCFSFSFL